MNSQHDTHAFADPIKIDHPYIPARILAHRNRLECLLRGVLVAPITVDVELTDACDNRCPWCEYQRLRGQGGSALSRDMALRLLDELAESPVQGVILSGGGEPTLHPHFDEIAEKLACLRMQAALFTHGGYLERSRAAIVKAFAYLRVSMDAGSSLTHAAYHSKDARSFERLLDNLHVLRKASPELCLEVSFLVAQQNYTEIATLMRLLASIPVDFLLVKFSRFPRDNHWITPNVLESIEEQILGSEVCYPTYYRPPARESTLALRSRNCPTTCLKAVVAPDGRLYLCNQRRGEEAVALGSLHEDGFWKIWGSERHRKVYECRDAVGCSPCRHEEYSRLLEAVQIGDFPRLVINNNVRHLLSFL